MPSTVFKPRQRTALLERVARAVRAASPADPPTVTVTALLLGTGVVAITTDQPEWPARGWDDLTMPLRRLRSGMYRPDVGTWFEIEVTVPRDGRCRARYNHTREPVLAPAASPEHWAKELWRYPRSPHRVPEWMRAKVAAAPNVHIIANDAGAATLANAFSADWSVSYGWLGELTFDCAWGSLRSFSRNGNLHLIGKVDSGRFGHLEELLAGCRPAVNAELYGLDGRLLRRVGATPRRSAGSGLGLPGTRYRRPRRGCRSAWWWADPDGC